MNATSDQGRVVLSRLGTDGSVARLSLNRPAALNALTPAMVHDLRAGLAHCDAEPSIRAVVLDGGVCDSFCAGADLRSTSDDELLEPLPAMTPRLSSKPSVVAVRGWAVGVGFKLACAADLVVTSSDAVFWAPETQVGILGGADFVHRLVRLLPYRVAMELALVGTKLPAERARVLGLVLEVVPPDSLLERAIRVAELTGGVNSPVDTHPGDR